MAKITANATVAAYSTNMLETVVRDGMEEYGTYVLQQRVVPDVRDGLKPVQRKILYSLYKKGANQSTHFAKTSSLVSMTSDLHPHGDMSIMPAMAKLTCNSEALGSDCRYVPIEGYGNWGSYSDGPAAARYTECRLSALGEQSFANFEVCPLVMDYKNELQEPLVIPSRVPWLLLNGSNGVAVGLSNNIPEHNLTEVLDCAIAYVRNGYTIDWPTIWQHLKGPDSGWGGVITTSENEMRFVYETGTGTIRYRCNWHYETLENGHFALVITGFFPGWLGTEGSGFNNFMALCQNRVAQGDLIDATDQSSGTAGIRIVLEYENHYVIQELLSYLHGWQSYRWYTTLRSVNSQGEMYVSLKQTDFKTALTEWVDSLYDFEEKWLNIQVQKTQQQLDRQNARYLVATNLSVLKDALDQDDPAAFLMTALGLNQDQTTYVLDASLRTFAKTNLANLNKAITETTATLTEWQKWLNNLDDWLVHLWESYKQYDYERLVIREAEPAMLQSNVQWWCLGFGKQLERYTTLPNRKPDWACLATDGFLTITKHGLVGQWLPSNLPGTNYDDCVFVLPWRDLLVTVDEQGFGTICEAWQTVSEWYSIKTSNSIMDAVTIRPGENLMIFQGSNHIIVPFEQLVPTRRNTKGYKLLPNSRGAIELLAWNPKQDLLVDVNGMKVTPTQWYDRGAWVVKPTNNIVARARSVQILDGPSTIAALQAYGDLQVWS